MMSRYGFCLLVCAALGACAYKPPTRTDRLDIRQVPFTPDSGSLAIRCGKLIDGVADTAMDNVLVVIRDGRIREIRPGASRGDAAATHVPVLDLSEYTCLPGLIDMHTHLTDRPEDTADLTVYFSRPAEETLRQSHGKCRGHLVSRVHQRAQCRHLRARRGHGAARSDQRGQVRRARACRPAART